MSIIYSDLVELAKKMLADDPSETEIRSAVSRAYYGLFHCAHDIIGGRLPKTNPKTGERYRGGTHAQLSQHVLTCSEDFAGQKKAFLQRLSVKLKMNHNLRCKADYELQKEITLVHADMIMKDISSLIHEAEHIARSVA